MNKKILKICIIVIVLLVAGISYSCKRLQSIDSLKYEETTIKEASLEAENSNEAEEDKEAKTQSTVETQSIEDKSCVVYVCGEVISPGVYELNSTERIAKALEMAGGFTDNAAKEYINLAEYVTDGMKIYIPSIEESRSGVINGSEAAASNSKGLVNINIATKEELMTLRGIGESRAEDIIAYREKNQGFKSIEDIMNISGIKDSLFNKIKDNITV